MRSSYGDSRNFAKHLQAGDVVLLDGPKEFRALKSLHDCSAPETLRGFIHDSGHARRETLLNVTGRRFFQ